ncbi:hypothetical protein GOP47_0013170 [Adiantum capillus-veneris]|uniref:Uncharacterized protein n=1 Tax=Adiantum capillus-veneris TaxID=13818 RepID=A0A9D4UNL0_ADICA|nr:hypothetical protein GOP47_0013170 [Adiantum capillus-veneris]
MASKLPPPTPRLKSHARTVSLDSGGKTPPGPKYFNAESTHKSVAERRSSRPAHMEKRTMTGRVADGQDDHSRVKEQLAMIERSKFNLMQDLARAKRNVDELTMKVSGVNGSCKNDKVHSVEKESAVFLEKEGWQVELDAMKQRYELALMELQTSKQAMESLKHELMVCVEAKDEAVRLAGEAMSAAESTARRVEVLSAELSSTKGSTLLGDCTTAGMDDLIDELPESMESLIEVPHKSTTQEETLQPLVAAEINKNTTESLKSENVEANVNALKVEDVQHKDREMSDVLTNGSVEALQKELAAAKEAEHTAIQKLLFVQAGMETVTVEAEKFKNAESIAQDLLTKTCSQLEEAEEKLAKASVEDAALLASLESLKAELEKSQQEAIQALDREAIARNKTMEVLDRMERARESNQAELSMWKEKEASARAMVESLQMDFERHKSEATLAAEKESIAAAKVSEMIEELGRNRNELIEQQKHSSIEIAALREKLDANQAKLVALEERESSSASSIATLEFDLQKKQAEVVDLKCMLSEVESKAEATSAELSRLREDNLQLAELKMKEREASAEVTALNIEVSGLKQAVEEALNAGRASRDELSKVEATFQNVVLERDEATREMKEVYLQAELSRQSATNLLADAKAAREDTERALNEVRAASKAAVDEALLACKLAEEKAQLAREETSVEKEKLEAALKDVEIASMEVVKMKKEAQSVREEADIQKGALAVEKERANAFQDEAQGVLGELVKLRSELTQLQTDVKEAVSARKDAEFRLQLATEQLEADKLREKEEGHVKDMSQEEMASLKEKLRVCEDQLKISTSEAEALQSCRAELMRELETVKVEREVSKRAVMDAHQHLADMEKAKRVMEADIQRLLDDSKLWKCSKDTRDILVLSEMNGINGHVLMADSRDEKPQPDSPARELLQNMDSTYLHINTENRGDEMIAEKEEEGEAPVEEAPIRVGKKKKPALLHRLHSYLDKKKTVQAP